MSYIGQTCDPEKRNNDFLNLRVQYAGKKIENARKKYRPENFKNEILEIIECNDDYELAQRLNELERQYIAKFDSLEHGYNDTIGGGGATGYKHSDKYKEWQSKKSKELNNDPKFKLRQKEGMATYFSNPEAHAKASASVRKRYSNPEERQRTSMIQKKSHAENPERAKRQGRKLSKKCSTPEGRKRMSETSKAGWKKPEVQLRQQERMKQQWSQPGYKQEFHTKHLGMNGKPVRQLTMDGVLIKEYVSACAAAEELGYCFGSIARVCRGERSHYKGYKWEYVQ